MRASDEQKQMMTRSVASVFFTPPFHVLVMFFGEYVVYK